MFRPHAPRLANRWRITGWILLVVTVVVAVTGTMAVRAMKGEFTAEIDQDLRQEARATVTAFEVIDSEILEEIAARPGFGDAPRALMVLTPVGIEFAVPSGSPDDPDPLPDLESQPFAQMRAASGEPFELTSADGSVSYRALAVQRDEEALVVVATPLADRDNAIRTLIKVLVAATLLATVVIAVIVALVSGYVTRPLDAMIDTAEGIGSGDLQTRVPTDGVDDVARLARALNAMLDRLERAFLDKQASEETLRRFVADASHELRTPLSAVLGYAELYQSGMATSTEQVDHAMERISAEGERMRLLVEELLMLARLDQGRPSDPIELDLARLVTEAVRDAEAIAPGRPITLDVPEQPVPVVGEPSSLRRAVDNLLANTRSHTPADTAVVVRLVVADDTVAVVVSDDGPGLDPGDAAHVFERFFRAERSRSRPGGAGLGLAIVAAIAEAHHGTVAVESSPGEGATFTLTLPVVASPTTTSAAVAVP